MVLMSMALIKDYNSKIFRMLINKLLEIGFWKLEQQKSFTIFNH